MAYANNQRDYHIFEDYAYYLMEQARRKRATDIFQLGGNVYAFDSTTMSGAKKNLRYKAIKWKRKLPENVLSDAEIELAGLYSKQYYPKRLRLICYHDEEQNRDLMFLTNALSITALQVAQLYKNRWQVELFFKWLKQHLKIKRFWGETENAVRIQIYCAICAYCLVAIVQHDMLLQLSTYETLQILGISLTDNSHLTDLLNRVNLQYVKEQNDPNGQLFINF